MEVDVQKLQRLQEEEGEEQEGQEEEKEDRKSHFSFCHVWLTGHKSGCFSLECVCVCVQHAAVCSRIQPHTSGCDTCGKQIFGVSGTTDSTCDPHSHASSASFSFIANTNASL